MNPDGTASAGPPGLHHAAHRTASPAQARELLRPELRVLLGHLMTAERSAGEVAQLLGAPLQRAHYLLSRLNALGVAEVSSVQPRAGRAVRRYRVAGRWFIPFRATGAETLEAFLGAQIVPRVQGHVQRAVAQLSTLTPDWGYWLSSQEGSEEAGGSLRLGGPDGESPFDIPEPLLLNLGYQRMRPERAHELRNRLLALLDEFPPEADETLATYSLGLFMVRGQVD